MTPSGIEPATFRLVAQCHHVAPTESQSLPINNVALGTLPKRLLFMMVKNQEFLDTASTATYYFWHCGLSNFVMYVNGQQIPTKGLSMKTAHEKTTVMGYRTLFEGSGIHHANSGLQITRGMLFHAFFDEASDDCCPPTALLSRFGPCGLFLVPEINL